MDFDNTLFYTYRSWINLVDRNVYYRERGSEIGQKKKNERE